MLKILKKAVLLIAVMLMAAGTVSAQNYSVPQEMAQYGEDIYSGARSFFHRSSFSGYCGTYVRCQLRAMGIFKEGFDFHGNGNQWYSNFDNVEKTSGGYYVYQESGSDCIDKLTAKYGENLNNIVLSFPIQAGYSARYKGAGHALVLYELRDGIAYYSESFGFGSYREGEVIAEDIESLMSRYSSRHGEAIGAVLLSPYNLETEVMYLDEEVLDKMMEHLETLSDIEFVASEFTQISQSRVTA